MTARKELDIKEECVDAQSKKEHGDFMFKQIKNRSS